MTRLHVSRPSPLKCLLCETIMLPWGRVRTRLTGVLWTCSVNWILPAVVLTQVPHATHPLTTPCQPTLSRYFQHTQTHLNHPTTQCMHPIKLLLHCQNCKMRTRHRKVPTIYVSPSMSQITRPSAVNWRG